MTRDRPTPTFEVDANIEVAPEALFVNEIDVLAEVLERDEPLRPGTEARFLFETEVAEGTLDVVKSEFPARSKGAWSYVARVRGRWSLLTPEAAEAAHAALRERRRQFFRPRPPPERTWELEAAARRRREGETREALGAFVGVAASVGAPATEGERAAWERYVAALRASVRRTEG